MSPKITPKEEGRCANMARTCLEYPEDSSTSSPSSFGSAAAEIAARTSSKDVSCLTVNLMASSTVLIKRLSSRCDSRRPPMTFSNTSRVLPETPVGPLAPPDLSHPPVAVSSFLNALVPVISGIWLQSFQREKAVSTPENASFSRTSRKSAARASTFRCSSSLLIRSSSRYWASRRSTKSWKHRRTSMSSSTLNSGPLVFSTNSRLQSAQIVFLVMSPVAFMASKIASTSCDAFFFALARSSLSFFSNSCTKSLKRSSRSLGSSTFL